MNKTKNFLFQFDLTIDTKFFAITPAFNINFYSRAFEFEWLIFGIYIYKRGDETQVIMDNVKHLTCCKTCGNIIFDGTPGEIYAAEKHEAECKNFEYEELFQCTNCDGIYTTGDAAGNCECWQA